MPFIFVAGCGSTSNGNTNNEEEKQPTTIIENDDVLVVYFSVTNNTKKIASYAQEHLECDIFEIVPMEEYTSADIAYQSDCRANREQNDDSARPEIKYQIEDIAKYSTIVLGYPIWWSQAPKIMYTFIESYDFSNKTILPFCTSGSSPIGNSATNLAKSASNANWLEGKRFSSSDKKEIINEWLDNNLRQDINMELFIDDKKVDVSWEDNSSVDALKKVSLNELNISMNRYSTFEQVGSIGQSIVSNDINIKTGPGDIVLYSSNQLVIFFGSNTWGYTKLGHINLDENELDELLNKPSIIAVLKGEKR